MDAAAGIPRPRRRPSTLDRPIVDAADRTAHPARPGPARRDRALAPRSGSAAATTCRSTPPGGSRPPPSPRAPFGDVAAIVSSPLRRARQTAEAIAAALGLPVVGRRRLRRDRLRRVGGADLRRGARARRRTSSTPWVGSPDVAPPGGESFAALARRVRRGRDAIVAAHPDATVLVVTHVSPIKMLVRAALDAPLAGDLPHAPRHRVGVDARLPRRRIGLAAAVQRHVATSPDELVAAPQRHGRDQP